jgi:uncharacterized membrane protein (DUF485 family)
LVRPTFQDIFRIRVWGVVNIGLLFALSEFAVAWIIAWVYSRKASRDFDVTGRADMRAVCHRAAARRGRRHVMNASYRGLTFAVFAVMVAITMFVTYLAAKRVRSASDFYTAGGGVSGWQNGWAIAGDYLSAASFLGIAG